MYPPMQQPPINPLLAMRLNALYGGNGGQLNDVPRSGQFGGGSTLPNRMPVQQDVGGMDDQQQMPSQMGGGPSQVPPQQQQPPPYDVMARMNQLYQPQTEMMDRLRNQLNQFPQRADYQPSRLERIGAVLSGLGGMRPMGISGGQVVGLENNPLVGQQARDNELYGRYNRAVGDWENQNKSLNLGAELENRTNTQNRMFAEQTVRNELTQQQRDIERQKSDQINQYKYDQLYADMAAKERTAAISEARWLQDTTNKANQLQYLKDKLDLTLSQHEMDKKQQQDQFDRTFKQRDEHWQAQIEQLQRQLAETIRGHDLQYGDTTTTTSRNPAGDTITRSTSRTPFSQKQGQKKYMKNPQTGEVFDVTTWSPEDVNKGLSNKYYWVNGPQG